MHAMDRLAAALSRPLVWLWTPLLSAPLMYGSYRVSPGFFDTWMRPETGFIENATFVWYLLAGLLGIATLRRRARLPGRWVRAWFACFAAGCLVVAAEEISWGQTWFGWQTPAAFAAWNDQGETSLHNTSQWLNRVPRNVLAGFAILLGGVWTLGCRLAGTRFRDVSDWRHWIHPGVTVVPVTLLVATSRWPWYLERWLGLDYLFVPDFGKYTEIQEFYLGAFVLLYGGAVLRRSARAKSAAPASVAIPHRSCAGVKPR